jgi:hypothetical protein
LKPKPTPNHLFLAFATQSTLPYNADINKTILEIDAVRLVLSSFLDFEDDKERIHFLKGQSQLRAYWSHSEIRLMDDLKYLQALVVHQQAEKAALEAQKASLEAQKASLEAQKAAVAEQKAAMEEQKKLLLELELVKLGGRQGRL